MNTAFLVLLIAYFGIGVAYSFYSVHVWCTEEKRSLVSRFVAFPLNRGLDGMAPLAEMLLDGHTSDWTFSRVVYQLGIVLFWPAKVAMMLLIGVMYAPYAMFLVTLFLYYYAFGVRANPAPHITRMFMR
jgi:hypothetical protein